MTTGDLTLFVTSENTFSFVPLLQRWLNRAWAEYRTDNETIINGKTDWPYKVNRPNGRRKLL